MTGARIPADVDREDRLLAGLTGRQLAEVAAGVAVALPLRAATAALPLPLSLAACALPIAAAAGLALARLDGVGADRLVLAWAAHRRGPALLVPAPEGVVAAPAGLPAGPACAPLLAPARSVDEDGVVDLGPQGRALLCRATSLNFGLRTPAEQAALVAVLGRWLNSLASPVQIVVRTEPVDVGELLAEIDLRPGALAHPDLERAAAGHARFLSGLAARRNLLRREILVVFADGRPGGDGVAVRRQAEDAAATLAGAGIVVEPLGRADALAVLARAADPDRPAGPGVLEWGEDPVVSGPAS